MQTGNNGRITEEDSPSDPVPSTTQVKAKEQG